MKRRRAISLVELLLTLSASAVILTLSAGLIHRVMHVQSKARAFVDAERSSLRLANQFRHDVHEAQRAETEGLPEGVFVRLALPDNRVVDYHQVDASILRILMEGGAPKGREEFVFPPAFNATIDQNDSGIVMLTIESQPSDSPREGTQPSLAYAVPLSLHVEALLNRHFSGGQEDSR